ncbi:hypothetical protein F0562_006322 [Nyssa sinensis]|uniref:Uncharacterized protein n=1 Tax=Nyssa sinensis TaxID=561372 RepID=A0A5J5AKN8_9ASTE|nr:hypothetical protein F0562_006322 [Nyssa sinensis]
MLAAFFLLVAYWHVSGVQVPESLTKFNAKRISSSRTSRKNEGNSELDPVEMAREQFEVAARAGCILGAAETEQSRHVKQPRSSAAAARQQQSDETPMVWEMLLYIYILYAPDWHYRSTMPTFLFLYGAAFAVVHSLESIAKVWFEWNEYCGHQDFEFGSVDLKDCGDDFFESISLSEDVKALYRRFDRFGQANIRSFANSSSAPVNFSAPSTAVLMAAVFTKFAKSVGKGSYKGEQR